jgi:hypothetical protein
MVRPTSVTIAIYIKSILLLLILFSSVGLSNAQNPPDAYIHDGSFEEITEILPTASTYSKVSEFHLNWKDVTNKDIGPCLLNTYTKLIGKDHWVPINELTDYFYNSNWWSYQWPIFYDANNDPVQTEIPDQKGYVGIRFKRQNINGVVTYFKDYLWQSIRRPLKNDTKYYFTFYTSLGLENLNKNYYVQSSGVCDWCFEDSEGFTQEMFHLKRLGAYFTTQDLHVAQSDPIVLDDAVVQVYSDVWLNQLGGVVIEDGLVPSTILRDEDENLNEENIPTQGNWMKVRKSFETPETGGAFTKIYFGNFQDEWTSDDLKPYRTNLEHLRVSYLVDGLHLCGCEDGNGANNDWGAYGVKIEGPAGVCPEYYYLRLYLDDRACQVNKFKVFEKTIDENEEEVKTLLYEYPLDNIPENPYLDYDRLLQYIGEDQKISIDPGAEMDIIVEFYNTKEYSGETICRFDRHVKNLTCDCPSHLFDKVLTQVKDQTDPSICRYNIILSPIGDISGLNPCEFDEVEIVEFVSGARISEISDPGPFPIDQEIIFSDELIFTPTSTDVDEKAIFRINYYNNGEFICGLYQEPEDCKCNCSESETRIIVEASETNPPEADIEDCCYEVYIEHDSDCQLTGITGISNYDNDYPTNLFNRAFRSPNLDFDFYPVSYGIELFYSIVDEETVWQWSIPEGTIFPTSNRIHVGTFCSDNDRIEKEYDLQFVNFNNNESPSRGTSCNTATELITCSNGVCCPDFTACWNPDKYTDGYFVVGYSAIDASCPIDKYEFEVNLIDGVKQFSTEHRRYAYGEYHYVTSDLVSVPTSITITCVDANGVEVCTREVPVTCCCITDTDPNQEQSTFYRDVVLTVEKYSSSCPDGYCLVEAQFVGPGCITHYRVDDGSGFSSKALIATLNSYFTCIEPGENIIFKFEFYRGYGDPNPCIQNEPVYCDISCCDFIDVDFNPVGANATECCWEPVLVTSNDELCSTLDVDVRYIFKESGEPVTFTNGKICVPQGQSKTIRYIINIDGVDCFPRDYTLTCDGCPCDEDYDWIDIKVEKSAEGCDPDDCKVTAHINIPTEFQDCFTHYNFQQIVGNAPNGISQIVDFGEIKYIQPDGLIPIGSTCVPPKDPMCIPAGRTFLLKVKLYSGPDDTNPCEITGSAEACPKIELVNPIGCDSDEPWNINDETVVVSIPPCNYVVHFKARKIRTDEEISEQEISITGIEAQPGCDDPGQITGAFQNALPKIANKLIKDREWEPSKETSERGFPCFDTWRVSQATCWSKWGYGGEIGTTGPESILLIPCEDVCCKRQLLVCNHGGKITISDLGFVEGGDVSVDCSTSVLIPPPVAGGTFMEGCTNYDCAMFEGIGIELDKSTTREDEYDRELTKAMFPPRAIDFNDDMKNNGSGISKIIYRANYIENNLELKILKSSFDRITININNILGTTIATKEYNLNGGYEVFNIDLSKQVSGAYIFNLESEGRIIGTGKFIIVK